MAARRPFPRRHPNWDISTFRHSPCENQPQVATRRRISQLPRGAILVAHSMSIPHYYGTAYHPAGMPYHQGGRRRCGAAIVDDDDELTVSHTFFFLSPPPFSLSQFILSHSDEHCLCIALAAPHHTPRDAVLVVRQVVTTTSELHRRCIQDHRGAITPEKGRESMARLMALCWWVVLLHVGNAIVGLSAARGKWDVEDK
ncbi:hypothetical protein DFP72DRAFT_1083595 [Ephemerocybe angulata]|uniref:Uncharacterized protein n=1 Tax=Ephemerocybe angulata TaxID=980116 RepID=A0A8H6H6X6_9AGAR|nr:hypothetical protein DFP72DRAFT_1083591 [Tulosesus angulatus]KAF6741588.1 hypothetical protein DFP72DRAFT_1083595 [Tulosesus angulatus]